MSVADLAHELNSLLDGSIRSLSLAERSLDSGADEHAMARVFDSLRVARIGLRHMADLLDRALREPDARLTVFSQPQTVGDVIHWVVESAQPQAREHHIELRIRMDQASAAVPARTLGPVILNGVRNALRAAAKTPSLQQFVEITAAIGSSNQLEITIADSGQGLPQGFSIGSSEETDGHGIGLELSRRLVTDLGGRFSIENSQIGQGAVLRVEVPCERLNGP